MRAGVDGNDLDDTSGDFADVAILRLVSDAPGNTAVMAWEFPSSGEEWGTKVGSGAHWSHDNPSRTREIRQTMVILLAG
jgi:hypothetical protein